MENLHEVKFLVIQAKALYLLIVIMRLTFKLVEDEALKGEIASFQEVVFQKML